VIPDADANPGAGDPLEEEGIRPAAEDLRVEVRVVEVQQTLEHRHRQRPPPAPGREGPRDHAGHGSPPAAGVGATAGVGGKEDDHAVPEQRDA
jgi:hypothetical protein